MIQENLLENLATVVIINALFTTILMYIVHIITKERYEQTRNDIEYAMHRIGYLEKNAILRKPTANEDIAALERAMEYITETNTKTNPTYTLFDRDIKHLERIRKKLKED